MTSYWSLRPLLWIELTELVCKKFLLHHFAGLERQLLVLRELTIVYNQDYHFASNWQNVLFTKSLRHMVYINMKPYKNCK